MTTSLRLFLLFAGTLMGGRQLCAQAQGGWWGDLFLSRGVSLQTVLNKPEAWRGQQVRFVFQFHRLATPGDPYFTRFDEDGYLRAEGWPDEAPLWQKSRFLRDFKQLFVRRHTPLLKQLQKAPLYSRWQVRATVEEVLKGKPWMEIQALKPLPTLMNEASLIHMVKGYTLLRIHRLGAAVREFAAADAQSLPSRVRLRLLFEEARALGRLGKVAAAIKLLRKGRILAPDNPELSGLLSAFQKRIKRPQEEKNKGQPSHGPGGSKTPHQDRKPVPGKGAEVSSKDK